MWSGHDTLLVLYAVNQYFGMSVIDTIKTWPVMETIISVFGMALVLVMNLIV
ncbi:MAG TPA: hypothetical protein VF257_10590 [Solirubrobacteraceae bacterium]